MNVLSFSQINQFLYCDLKWRIVMKPKEISVFPIGEFNKMFAQYFVGNSYLTSSRKSPLL